MMIRIPAVLDAATLQRVRNIILHAEWEDGEHTAGTQSVQVKNNRQLPQEGAAAVQARALVLEALSRHALFFTAALPKKIYPPLFNRYGGAQNAFGNHIDNAIRTWPATARHVRTDLSATLFLADPDSYDGGELIVENAFDAQRIKLKAGDMILYPSSSVHRVEPVTRGERLASFFWIESMVRDDAQRRLLFDMDMAILALRTRKAADAEDDEVAVSLTGTYHNLLRMWADT